MGASDVPSKEVSAQGKGESEVQWMMKGVILISLKSCILQYLLEPDATALDALFFARLQPSIRSFRASRL